MRVAYFSPLPPQRSGIADYSEALLPNLARHCELDVFIEDYAPANPELRNIVRLRPWREFEEEHARGLYDAVLYHIGNNPQHVYIYELAVRIPGVLMLHEFNIHYLLAEVTLRRDDWEGYFRELEYNAGPEALEHARRAQRGEVQPEYDRIAMNRRLLENSRAAIVHSDYMVQLLRASGFSLPLARIPHGVQVPQVEAQQARARLGLDHRPVVGSFGFLKPYKRLHSALHAFRRLERTFPDAQLLLVGEEHPHNPLWPLVQQLHLEDRVRIPGFVLPEEFVEYMAACDVCLNLRHPTVGESSGSLLREMALGKPVVVSNVGWYAELPEDACIKLPPGDEEVDWLAEYLAALLNGPELREKLGGNARRWAEEECSWEKVAAQYAAFLREQKEAAPTPTASAPALDRQAVAAYILSFAVESKPMEDYVRLHLQRLVHTVEITPPARPGSRNRVLEMGCYMQLTPALGRFLGYQEMRGCYYGQAGNTHHKVVYSANGERFECEMDLFDAERDAFPYPDAHFDTVLCCELIEHLLQDPMHMMAEINRVLKPGGHLVMSTPNITGLRGVEGVLLGYHPGFFHTYVVPKEGGEVDPRHSREYAPRDLLALFRASGLEMVRLETGWLGEKNFERYAHMEQFLVHSGFSRDLRGDIIYALGRKVGTVRERYPGELYTAF